MSVDDYSPISMEPGSPEHLFVIDGLVTPLCSCIIRIDDLFLIDGIIKIIISVKNLAMHKKVTIRYTTDNWISHNDIDAEWQFSFFDRDCFYCYLNADDSIEFAVRYQVNDQEYWINNDGNNYKLADANEL